MTARNQHYVWRYYLTAWQNNDGLINCLLRGKMLRTNPRNIMAERDFYKMSRFTQSDIAFFATWLDRLESKEMAELHWFILDMMLFGTTMNDMIQRSDLPDDAKWMAQSAVIEGHERIHGMIEAGALPTIRQLRQGCTSSLENDKAAIAFFRYVGHQYCRTKSVRDAIEHTLRQPSPIGDLSRLANIMCLCVAENIGVWLFSVRSDLDVCMLQNDNDIDFITGDQPLVNLAGGDGLRPPDELVLYYPVSPRLAMIIARSRHGIRATNVPRRTVERLNDFIRWRSRVCLVSESRELLQNFAKRPLSKRPSGARMLSRLR